jgi:hypothetical protein
VGADGHFNRFGGGFDAFDGARFYDYAGKHGGKLMKEEGRRKKEEGERVRGRGRGGF